MRTAISLDDADNEGFNVPAIPPATSQPVAPPKPDADNEKFPATLADSFVLFRQIEAAIGRTPGGLELRALQARIEHLRWHIHTIQQGDMPKESDRLAHMAAQRDWSKASARTELLLAHADSGDAQAKKELEAIRASSARHDAKRPARKPAGKGLRDRIAGNADVQKSIAAAAEAGDRFRQTFIDLDESLFFEEKARSCAIALDSATGLKEVGALRARLLKLRAPGADAARRAAQVAVAESFKQFSAALSQLLQVAKSKLVDIESEIEVAETALFDGFGLQRQETSLWNHVRAIAGKLDEFDSTLSAQEQRPHTLSPAVGEAILQFFSL
ncbi:MAG: hypothetical protein DME24_23980 [Verrucomicrobia bacterium]|nr:MAG: hypothetical protein DME24_23980 [Verrucomicrobiota bacterium]